MPRPNFNDLIAFRAVAQQRSFTRAAAQMGLSPSALSHAVRGLEERIGVRLLTRTTRSVSPTQAGERLLATVGPSFDEIEAELARQQAAMDEAAKEKAAEQQLMHQAQQQQAMHAAAGGALDTRQSIGMGM